jgi:hypothetical protein
MGEEFAIQVLYGRDYCFMAEVIAFDIDGVLTVEDSSNYEDMAGSYAYRTPNKENIALVNEAVSKGWCVVLFTGRHEGYRKLTENWLFAHGVNYHFLIMDKPYFKYIVDDRARNVSEIKEIINGQ